MSKIMVKNKMLYWALIGTFTALYLAVAFVSTLHAVTFFQLANTLGLAILLGAAYEIGQAAVLFSILMTENKNRMLAWSMMFLLTALQVTANVYASFKYMDASGSQDWTYWQRAILFGVEADSPEMYKVIISWISGALLPLVALGMTALVAENIRMARGEKLGVDEDEDKIPRDKADEIIENEVQKRVEEILSEPAHSSSVEDDEEFMDLIDTQESIAKQEPAPKEREGIIKDAKVLDLDDKKGDEEYVPIGKNADDIIKEAEKKIEEEEKKYVESTKDKIKKSKEKIKEATKDMKPVNKTRGWHFANEYIDDEHNVFHRGKFVGKDPSKTPTSKKA